MNKKLIMITLVVAIVVMAAAGTALAYNGNGASDGSSQRFTASVEDFETVEDFHAAILTEKMVIIEAKVADKSMTQEEADALIEYLTSCDCDEDCTLDGENPNRPEEGWGIFGEGTGDGIGVGEGNGYKGSNENKGTGNGARLAECDEDGEPLLNGSGSEGTQGNGRRGGNK